MGRARGDWLVFLGDDTVPDADFLVEHLRARGGVEKGADRVVAIGYTPWAREYLRTRFMEYVGEEGWQFGFSLIEDKSAVPFNFFYTSNLSISREFFRESGDSTRTSESTAGRTSSWGGGSTGWGCGWSTIPGRWPTIITRPR